MLNYPWSHTQHIIQRSRHFVTELLRSCCFRNAGEWLVHHRWAWKILLQSESFTRLLRSCLWHKIESRKWSMYLAIWRLRGSLLKCWTWDTTHRNIPTRHPFRGRSPILLPCLRRGKWHKQWLWAYLCLWRNRSRKENPRIWSWDRHLQCRNRTLCLCGSRWQPNVWPNHRWTAIRL